jgi:hypothetical protein
MRHLRALLSTLLVILLLTSLVALPGCSKNTNSDSLTEVPDAQPQSSDPRVGRNLFLRTVEAPDTNATPISTPEELMAVANDLSGSYVLTADIDLSGFAGRWQALGSSDEPFSGTLDGQGYLITGLTIFAENRLTAGLFTAVDTTGTIENLGLNDCIIAPATCEFLGGLTVANKGTISNCFVSGYLLTLSSISPDREVCAGGLASQNGGRIEDSYFAGILRVELPSSQSALVGGIAAFEDTLGTDGRGTENITIARCFSMGLISVQSEAISGGSYYESQYQGIVGGILGTLFTGTVEDCGNFAELRGTYEVGGICGRLSGKEPTTGVLRCLSAGAISGTSWAVSGIVGYAIGWGFIDRCVVLCSMTATGDSVRTNDICLLDDGF